MENNRSRVGGTDAVPIYEVREQASDLQVIKYQVGDTGVAFETREGAEAAARKLQGLDHL